MSNDLRPSVDWFANAMEQTLRMHDRNKGECGWLGMSESELLSHLIQEVSELVLALQTKDRRKIVSECADVANVAMMLADNAGPVDHNTVVRKTQSSPADARAYADEMYSYPAEAPADKQRQRLDLSRADEIINSWPEWKTKLAGQILRPTPPARTDYPTPKDSRSVTTTQTTGSVNLRYSPRPAKPDFDARTD